jgi:hypothetical protein
MADFCAVSVFFFFFSVTSLDDLSRLAAKDRELQAFLTKRWQEKRACGFCGKMPKNLKRCSGCGDQGYCDQVCQ